MTILTKVIPIHLIKVKTVTSELYCFQNAVGWRWVILFKIGEFTILSFVLPLSSLLSLQGNCQSFAWLFYTSYSPSSTLQVLRGYDYLEDLLLAVTQTCGWGKLWFKEIIRLCCRFWNYQEGWTREEGQPCPRREKREKLRAVSRWWKRSNLSLASLEGYVWAGGEHAPFPGHLTSLCSQDPRHNLMLGLGTWPASLLGCSFFGQIFYSLRPPNKSVLCFLSTLWNVTKTRKENPTNLCSSRSFLLWKEAQLEPPALPWPGFLHLLQPTLTLSFESLHIWGLNQELGNLRYLGVRVPGKLGSGPALLPHTSINLCRLCFLICIFKNTG